MGQAFHIRLLVYMESASTCRLLQYLFMKQRRRSHQMCGRLMGKFLIRRLVDMEITSCKCDVITVIKGAQIFLKTEVCCPFQNFMFTSLSVKPFSGPEKNVFPSLRCCHGFYELSSPERTKAFVKSFKPDIGVTMTALYF